MSNALPTANADDILAELESVLSYICEYSPTSTFERQNIPLQPQADSFIIRFQNASSRQETAISYVDTREWQIVYIGGKEAHEVADVLAKMNGVKRKVLGDVRVAIPVADSLRYMRVTGFSFGQPVKTEDDRHAIVGVLTTDVRKARDIASHEKIMKAGVRRG